jgi:TPR repeat protein
MYRDSQIKSLFDAWMYRNKRGVEQDDKQAMFWYRKAAEQGNAVAQYSLGGMYFIGSGVEQDNEQAVFWYRKAAEQGQVDAQCILGWMYANGRGVEQDDRQAAFWYRKAAAWQCSLGGDVLL